MLTELFKTKELYQFLEEVGITKPTPIQKKVISEILEGKSVKALAPTGSGKTFAFTLPMVEMLKLGEKHGKTAGKGAPRAIILSPTRELAHQILLVLKAIAHHAKFRARLAEGGDKGKTARSLRGQVFDVLVATPGRLASSLSKGEISLDHLEYMVLDEADQLVDMGFSKDIKKIVEHMNESVQVNLFSATSSPALDDLVVEFFNDWTFKTVIVKGVNLLTQKVDTFNIQSTENEKKLLLEMFLKKEVSPRLRGIIFVNKKGDADDLLKFFAEKFPKRTVTVLHGGLQAPDRKKAYQAFLKKGGVLIATDIAARGMDIKGLAWVLNYSLPFEAVYYVHRAGRTGRHGTTGKVYNFVTPLDINIVQRINHAIMNQDALSLRPIKQRKLGGQGAEKNKNKGPEKKTFKKKPRFSRRKK